MSNNPILIPDGTSLVSPQELAGTNDAQGDKEQHVRIAGGAGPANQTGDLTAAQPLPGTVVAGGTVGGAVDYSSVGNVTVAVFGATHAGFTVVMEASPDAGTTWFSMTAQDEISNSQAKDPIIPTNGSRLFSLSLFGLNRFRVRASARTSGTLSVVIAPGTALIEPVVAAVLSYPGGAQPVSYTATNAVGTVGTTEVVVPVAKSLNFAAAGAASATQTVTAGKTFRPLGLVVSHIAGTAAILRCVWNLRVNISGNVANTSPIIATTMSQNPAATAGSVGTAPPMTASLSIPDIPGGSGIGVSNVLNTASAATTSTVSLFGIEF